MASVSWSNDSAISIGTSPHAPGSGPDSGHNNASLSSVPAPSSNLTDRLRAFTLTNLYAPSKQWKSIVKKIETAELLSGAEECFLVARMGFKLLEFARVFRNPTQDEIFAFGCHILGSYNHINLDSYCRGSSSRVSEWISRARVRLRDEQLLDLRAYSSRKRKRDPDTAGESLHDRLQGLPEDHPEVPQLIKQTRAYRLDCASKQSIGETLTRFPLYCNDSKLLLDDFESSFCPNASKFEAKWKKTCNRLIALISQSLPPAKVAEVEAFTNFSGNDADAINGLVRLMALINFQNCRVKFTRIHHIYNRLESAASEEEALDKMSKLGCDQHCILQYGADRSQYYLVVACQAIPIRGNFSIALLAYIAAIWVFRIRYNSHVNDVCHLLERLMGIKCSTCPNTIKDVIFKYLPDLCQ